MESGSSNNPYKDPAEMAQKLRLSLEEAEALWKQWNHKMPTDPVKLRDYAHKAAQFEHGMRGLNLDRREGTITEAQYLAEEQKLRQQIYGD